jgi:hypothetical protein
LGKFWRALEWQMLKYFKGHMEYYLAVWYIFFCCHLG